MTALELAKQLATEIWRSNHQDKAFIAGKVAQTEAKTKLIDVYQMLDLESRKLFQWNLVPYEHLPEGLELKQFIGAYHSEELDEILKAIEASKEDTSE